MKHKLYAYEGSAGHTKIAHFENGKLVAILNLDNDNHYNKSWITPSSNPIPITITRFKRYFVFYPETLDLIGSWED